MIVLALGMILNSCVDSSTLHIDVKKHSVATDLEYGVSIVSPRDFKKAKSYIGIQAPKRAGSIELVIEEDFESLKHKYSKETIKAQRGKLYKHQPVQYGEYHDAFYVEYHDKPQKRYRQVLVISKDEVVYHVKAFHRAKPDHPLTNEIRKSLSTVHIGDFIDKGMSFSEAFIIDLNQVMYTRDNKNPTEEKDSLVVLVSTITKPRINLTNAKSFLKNRIKKNCEECEGCEDVRRDKLVNGHMFKCSGRSSSKSVAAILMMDKGNERILIESIGNEDAEVEEVADNMRSKFLTVQ